MRHPGGVEVKTSTFPQVFAAIAARPVAMKRGSLTGSSIPLWRRPSFALSPTDPARGHPPPSDPARHPDRGASPPGAPYRRTARYIIGRVGRVGRRRGHLLSPGKSIYLSRTRWGGPAPLRGARFIATGRGAQPRRPVDQPTQTITTPTGCRTGGRESATPWRGRGQDTDLSTGHRRCRGSTCGYEAGIPDGILRLPEMMSFPRSILLPILEITNTDIRVH